MKYVFNLFIIMLFVLLTGCEEVPIQSNATSTSSAGEENIMEEHFHGKEKEENMEENKVFLIEHLGLSEARAEGNAKILEQAGCGKIVNYENKENAKNAYTITLINDDGEKYFTAFDINGFIGPVKDEKGNYLYSPID